MANFSGDDSPLPRATSPSSGSAKHTKYSRTNTTNSTIMSDSAESHSIQPTKAELVAHGPKGVVETGAIKADKFKILKEEAHKHHIAGQGKEGIRAMVGANTEGRFSTLQSNALLEKFGGGKVKYNETSKNFDLPTEDGKMLTTAEKASFEGTKNVVQNLTNFLEYFEVASEVNTGRSLAEVIASKKDFQINSGNYPKKRAEALTFIANNTNGLFTEVALDADGNPLSGEALFTFIEKTLASDPIVRNKIAQGLKSAAEKADTLSKVDADEEVKTAEKTKSDATTEIAGIHDTIGTLFSEIGVEYSAATKMFVEDSIEKGLSADWIAGQIKQGIDHIGYGETKAIEGDAPEPARPLEQVFNEYNILLKELAETRADRRGASAGGGKGSGGKPAGGGAFGTLTEEASKVQEKIDAYKLKYINANSAAYEKFMKVQKYFGDKDPAAGTPTGEIISRFAKMRELTASIKTAEKTIASKKKDSDEKEASTRSTRLRQEAEIMIMLEGVMPNAIADALEARYDAVNKTLSEVKKKQEEKKMSENEKKIKKGSDTRWIEYRQGDRKKDPKVDRIQADMRTLAYQGEDGLKRMILRELGWTYKKDGNDTAINDSEAMNMDMGFLSDEQKKELNELVAKHGDAYRAKLETDFFLARTLGSRLKDRIPGTDKMGLKSHEWQLYEQNFSGKLTEALGKSQEAQRVLKDLESRGIRPDFKMKWLLYALLGLGAVGIGAAGILPAAAAIGAAAPAIGSAALHGVAA